MNSSSESMVVGGGVLSGAAALVVLLRLLPDCGLLTCALSAVAVSTAFLFRV